MLSESETIYDREFDVMMVGVKAVGKTSLASRFLLDDWQHLRRANIGLQVVTRVWEKDEKLVKMQLWDTPAIMCHRWTLPNLFRWVDAFLLVYDVSDRNSFLQLRCWLDNMQTYGNNKAICFLVGNKADLESSRQVTAEDVSRLSKKYNLATFETSAATGAGVEETFSSVLQILQAQPRPADPPKLQLQTPRPCNLLENNCC